MNKTAQEGIYFGFWASIILKGGVSLAEVITGAIVLFVPTTFLTDTASALIQTGILGGPHSFFAERLLTIIQEFTHGTQLFIAFYLLSRGIVKLGVIIALLKNQLWAYPASLVVLGILLLFQFYQIVTTFSIPVIAITIFDLVVMYFIWSEYQIVKKHHGERKEFFEEPTGTE